jgi:alkanesulfonate monooxygenase SsuD/methylene tetrahydromethanopterin reductase-like flavin-dependent oxidoreductase (luciferase family)
VQDPLPVWGGFFGPRGARLAGRLGMGLLAVAPEIVEPYVEGLEAGGHGAASARYRGAVECFVADDPEQAWAEVGPALAWQWDSYRRGMVEGTGRPDPRPIDPEAWRAWGEDGSPPRFHLGTPEQTVAYIRARCAGIPVEEVFVWTNPGGAVPDELADRHVELLLTKVAPAVREL